jgi:hypothetical protein
MKIRLHGTAAEVRLMAQLFRLLAEDPEADGFEVVDESRDYTDRAPSTLVRRYLEIRL